MINVRTVTVRGVSYLRTEDVAQYLREIAATEETDTRRRLLDAAQKLMTTQTLDTLKP